MESTSPAEAPIDRYVVLEYLAEGGMGAIYLGKKMGAGGFEKQVVLKQLLPEFTRQPEFIDLFLREARLSATLDHANIIHTIDLVTAGEDYFIVMEYLDGADLRTLLRRCKKKRRRLSPAAGIYIARELLSALAYAHNKVGPDGVPLRLIHRDISPSNILISGSGEVKLTDFGIAKASTHNSVFYRVKGKVGYMSPEQAKSEPLDARSDLYSLAVCLFEMMTGERLFVNVGLTTSADEMYAQPVPLISHKQPGLPPELDKVMLKALSRDPDHRYQTAGEFQEALLRCAHRHGLMMSAPDLAEHLHTACGEPAAWRDESDETGAAIGTELYEMDDEEEGLEPADGLDPRDPGDPRDDDGVDDAEAIDPDEVLLGGRSGPDSAESDMSVAVASGGQLLRHRDARRRRARTSITKLTELRGIALTSMINLAGGTSTDHAGASPLIDFNDLAQSPMLPSNAPETGPGAPGAPGGPLGHPGHAGHGGHPGHPASPGGQPPPMMPPPTVGMQQPPVPMAMPQGQYPRQPGPPGPPGPHPGHPGHPAHPPHLAHPAMLQGHPPTGPHPAQRPMMPGGAPLPQPPQGHPLAPPGVHPQPPRGSLADIDPLEQTGIVVEGPSLPAQMPPGPSGYPVPGMAESGPVQAVPSFMPPGASASTPISGRPGPGLHAAYAHTWAAAMAPAQRPWLLLAIILLVGIGTAALIGLSGPTIEAGSLPVARPTSAATTATTTRATTPAASAAPAPNASTPPAGAPQTTATP